MACSLVSIDEHKLLANIEKLLKKKIAKKIEPGFEVDQNIAAQPIQNGRNTQAVNREKKRDPKSLRNSSPERQNASRPKIGRNKKNK